MSGKAKFEPLWHVQFAIVIAMVFQFLLPGWLFPLNRYVVIALELLLLIALTKATPREYAPQTRARRSVAICLIGLTSTANIISLGMLVTHLLQAVNTDGRGPPIGAVYIFLTNIIVFGLWYWNSMRVVRSNAVPTSLVKRTSCFLR